jgi:hypothetical protein
MVVVNIGHCMDLSYFSQSQLLLHSRLRLNLEAKIAQESLPATDLKVPQDDMHMNTAILDSNSTQFDIWTLILRRYDATQGSLTLMIYNFL